MKVSWKGMSRIRNGGQQLLLLKVREEYDLVVDSARLRSLIERLRHDVELGIIESQVAKQWILEFEVLAQTITQLSDAGSRVRRLRLETPWAPWPVAGMKIIGERLAETFAANGFASIDGTAPNYQLRLHFGTSASVFPLQPEQLKPSADFIRSLDEAALDWAAERVRTGASTTSEEVREILARSGFAGQVAEGALLAVETSIHVHASRGEAILKIIEVLANIVTVVDAAVAAYERYQEAEKAKEEQREADAERARKEQQDREWEAGEVHEWSAGGPAFDAGMQDAGGLA